MRQLLPAPAEETDLWSVYRPHDVDAPLLRINMVTSVDGSVVDAEGRSGGLGGDGDWEVFRTLRAQADAVLVGAGTARAERYGPVRHPGRLAERRAADLGRGHRAGMVLVSRSVALDPTAPIFTDADPPTTVLTCAAADPDRRAALAEVADVIVAGDDTVDLRTGLAQVREQLGPLVLCEGGPTLNAALLDADLADELCITVAPQLVGALDAPRLSAPLRRGRRLRLRTACSDASGELYLRYGIT